MQSSEVTLCTPKFVFQTLCPKSGLSFLVEGTELQDVLWSDSCLRCTNQNSGVLIPVSDVQSGHVLFDCYSHTNEQNGLQVDILQDNTLLVEQKMCHVAMATSLFLPANQRLSLELPRYICIYKCGFIYVYI